MPEIFRTASARIKKKAWEDYNELCAKEGMTIHTRLKGHIEKDLEKKTIEREKTGLEKRNGGDSRKDDRQKTGIIENDACPFC